jgi:NifU-like protein involved in Fe-S cluster formation
MSYEENEGYVPSEIILDLYENPLHYGIIKDYNIKFNANNLDNGDNITIYIKLVKNTIKKIKFTFEGSVISKAGASIAIDLVLNKSIYSVLDFDNNIILKKLGDVIKNRQKCAFFAMDVLKNGFSSFINKNKLKLPFNLKLDI